MDRGIVAGFSSVMLAVGVVMISPEITGNVAGVGSFDFFSVIGAFFTLLGLLGFTVYLRVRDRLL